MPWDQRGFLDVAEGAVRPGDNPSRHRSIFHYCTDDAHTVVVAAGYFNPVRAMLQPGDIIFASTVLAGTPVLRIYGVVTVPATGNITVAQVITS